MTQRFLVRRDHEGAAVSPGHAGLFGSALPDMAEVNLTIVQTTVDFAMHTCSAKSSISELPHFAVSGGVLEVMSAMGRSELDVKLRLMAADSVRQQRSRKPRRRRRRTHSCSRCEWTSFRPYVNV